MNALCNALQMQFFFICFWLINSVVLSFLSQIMSFSYSNTQFNMLLFGSQERMSEKYIEKASFFRIFKHFLFL